MIFVCINNNLLNFDLILITGAVGNCEALSYPNFIYICILIDVHIFTIFISPGSLVVGCLNWSVWSLR